MLQSRQPQNLVLFGLLLALSPVYVSPPAQAGEGESETAVRGFEQAAAPLSLAVVLPVELPRVEPPAVELPPILEPPPDPDPTPPDPDPPPPDPSPTPPDPDPTPPDPDPPPPPPPASREIQGELTPDRPTIVLTHGLEADAGCLWTGFCAAPGAQGAGYILKTLLGEEVNIVQFLWEEGLQGFSPSAYSAAFPYTQDAGKVLADLLIEGLGPGYDHPIHFIGHSLGAVVNAYAARQFLTAAPGVGLSQLTILDYPTRTPGGAAVATPIPASFFATLLQDIRGLRIDNFYSRDPSALGNVTEGPIENHPKLQHPSDVGGRIFPAEPPASDHAGVQQWYRWTMNPNGLTGMIFCEGGTFNKPPSFSASLDPCRKGWQGSLFGPRPRPDPDPEPSVDVTSTPLGLNNPRPAGCEFVNGEITCPETASSSSISFDVDIPAGAGFIELDYAFSGADEGDYGAVHLDDVPAAVSRGTGPSVLLGSAVRNNGPSASASPIAILSPSSTPPESGFQGSGLIPLPTFQARGRRGIMTMSNYPARQPGS
ncbi:MAG: hypothetical protein ACREWE_04195, partial [Gammaproteobacteria bacterium]